MGTKIKASNIELSISLPPGIVLPWAGIASPAGWVRCNGQAVTRTGEFANLFAVVGTAYGIGDGSTTFNVPDLRGEFIRGADDGRGVDTGRALHSNQLDADQAMSGTLGRFNKFAAQHGAPTGPFTEVSFGVEQGISSGASDGYNSINFDNSTVIRTADETRPRNVAMHHIIKV